MDFLPDPDALSQWLLHYGSFALFLLLAIGIIALPVPEESLMVIAGALMANGKLCILPTVAAAFLGSCCGITGSYFIGRSAGNYTIRKVGNWIGLTEAHLAKAHEWFERYGTWSLTIGYFIPGIRHLTGITAGTTVLAFPRFMLFAYFGAALWVSTFLSIGYFFGNYWLDVYNNIDIILDYPLVIGVLLLLVGAAFYFVRKKKRVNGQDISKM